MRPVKYFDSIDSKYSYLKPLQHINELTYLKCKIKGLRSEATKQYIDRKAQEKLDHVDGSTLVKITGCEYKITEERLNEVLSHWGVLSSKI